MAADSTSTVDVLLIVAAALAASFIGLVVWAEDKGRPFGSKAATGWSCFIIVVLTAASTLASIFGTKSLPPDMQDFLPAVGLGLPFALLGVARLQPGDATEKTKAAPLVLSVGVSLLLRRLRGAMATALLLYMNNPSSSRWAMKTLETRTEALYESLRDYIGDDKLRRAALERNIKDFRTALQKAEKARLMGDPRVTRARSAARSAYRDLRKQAYLWRYDETARVSTQNIKLRRWLPGPP